jgi:hypothetical protein
VPIDLAHFAVRIVSPFDPSSRFYWPLVIAVFVAIAANIAWYYWRPGDDRPSPAEDAIRPWAFWVNVIFLIWALVLLIAKVPFYFFIVSLLLNVASLLWIYLYWLPPRDAAWERELRRLKYIPKPEQRRRRRR